MSYACSRVNLMPFGSPVNVVLIILQVPVAASPKTSENHAFRWIRDSADNKDKTVRFWDSLAKELLDASQNTVCSKS